MATQVNCNETVEEVQEDYVVIDKTSILNNIDDHVKTVDAQRKAEYRLWAENHVKKHEMISFHQLIKPLIKKGSASDFISEVSRGWSLINDLTDIV
jgi:hypothetical protein